jgi:hypothetical protein
VGGAAQDVGMDSGIAASIDHERCQDRLQTI